MLCDETDLPVAGSHSTQREMTSRKLFGKDLGQYDDVDVDDLLTQLSPEELEILSKEVDPDVSLATPAE